jgi:hypothetical protein
MPFPFCLLLFDMPHAFYEEKPLKQGGKGLSEGAR